MRRMLEQEMSREEIAENLNRNEYGGAWQRQVVATAVRKAFVF